MHLQPKGSRAAKLKTAPPARHLYSGAPQTGVARSIVSTDLGQTINPPVAEGFGMFAQRLLDAGFTRDDVRTMAVTNPTRLVEE